MKNIFDITINCDFSKDFQERFNKKLYSKCPELLIRANFSDTNSFYYYAVNVDLITKEGLPILIEMIKELPIYERELLGVDKYLELE